MKLTPWFPPEVKPVHKGQYRVKDRAVTRLLWTGDEWRTVKYGFTVADPVIWRGLAKQPKEQA